MAEATALRNAALPYPVYGAPYAIVLGIWDADGDLVTGASSLDSEISKNGDTSTDCTAEATEIGSTGMYYLTLTGTELTCDVASIIVKTGTAGAKTTPVVLYPRKLVTIRSGTSASGGSATDTIVLDASASALDDAYNGMLVIATIDGNVEARVISDYVGSTKTATVVPDWNVAPDNNDTFVIKLPEGGQIQQADAVAWNGTAVAAPNTAGVPKVDMTLIEGADASDTLAALDDATLAALSTIAGYLDTEVAAILAAVDTEVAAIKLKTDNLPSDPADASDIAAALATLSALVDSLEAGVVLTSAGVDAILDDPIEGSLTLRQALRIILAFAAGKASGGGSTPVLFRDQADTLNRISMVVDSSGNRSAVTVDPT